MTKKNILISGEKVDLCAPEEQDFSVWASWFNDQKITKFLEQGVFPNSEMQQKEFYKSASKDGRFLSLVKSKNNELLGVISLSNLNYKRCTCEVAYVCPVKSAKVRFSALEALSLVTQHAFDYLNMRLIYASHAYPGLINWIQKTEILGYKTNGLMPFGFKKGSLITDSVRVSITRQRYETLKQRRQGYLWPGEATVVKILDKLKLHPPLSELVTSKIKFIHQEHDSLLKKLESDARK